MVWPVIDWSGVSRIGLACRGLGWCVADWGGVVRSVLVWFGAGCTSLVWCSTVVDVLIVGRDITSRVQPMSFCMCAGFVLEHTHTTHQMKPSSSCGTDNGTSADLFTSPQGFKLIYASITIANGIYRSCNSFSTTFMNSNT
jgi:hypothetical protein